MSYKIESSDIDDPDITLGANVLLSVPGLLGYELNAGLHGPEFLPWLFADVQYSSSATAAEKTTLLGGMDEIKLRGGYTTYTRGPQPSSVILSRETAYNKAAGNDVTTTEYLPVSAPKMTATTYYGLLSQRSKLQYEGKSGTSSTSLVGAGIMWTSYENFKTAIDDSVYTNQNYQSYFLELTQGASGLHQGLGAYFGGESRAGWAAFGFGMGMNFAGLSDDAEMTDTLVIKLTMGLTWDKLQLQKSR